MKNENLMRAIGYLDEDLIVRAERYKDTVNAGTAQKIRFLQRPLRAAAIIAALLIIGATVCAAAGLFDGIFKHFSNEGDMDSYIDEIEAAVVSASNADLEISIEGAIMDNRQCLIVFSVTGLSDAGKQLASTADSPLDALDMELHFSDGNIGIYTDWTYRYHQGSRGEKSSYVLEILPTDFDLLTVEKLTLDFEGLTLELTMQNHVTDYVTLHSDDPHALEVVEMSPLGIYVEVPVADTDREALRQQLGEIEITPILADGLLAQDYYLHGSIKHNLNDPTIYVFDNFAVIDEHTMKITIVDIGEYSGLQVNGINYYRAEE